MCHREHHRVRKESLQPPLGAFPLFLPTSGLHSHVVSRVLQRCVDVERLAPTTFKQTSFPPLLQSPNRTLYLDIIQHGKNWNNVLKGVGDCIDFGVIFQIEILLSHTASGGELCPNGTKHIHTTPTCSEASTNAFGEQNCKRKRL